MERAPLPQAQRAETLVRIAGQARYDVPLSRTLHALAEAIVAETRAEAAGMAFIDPEALTTIESGTCNLPFGYIAAMDQARRHPGRAALFRNAVAENTPWIQRDTRAEMGADPAYADVLHVVRQLPPTLVASPFAFRPEAVGLIYLYYSDAIEVDEEEIEFARAIARQAAPIMDNAWLHNQAQTRLAELEALFRADEALRRSLKLDDVLQAMCELAIDLLGADSALVAAWGEDDHLSVRASRALEPHHLALVDRELRDRTRETMATLAPALALIEDVRGHEPMAEAVRHAGFMASLAEVPIYTAQGLFGFFNVGFRTRQTFTPEDRRRFDAFITRASLAIENALLFEQAQLAASNEERQRLARDLHDSVSQALYGIALGARTARKRLGEGADPALAEPIDYVLSLAEAGLAETRALIFELIPESLETQGLVVAIERQAAAIRARHQLDVQVFAKDEPELPLRTREAVYRIVQESLNNIVKHAGASHVRIDLAQAGGRVTVTVRDDGRGFDTGGTFPGHFGLQSMAERATRAGGAFAVESAPGAGATISVSVPGAGRD
ncbi:MAG: sensor histidine kinase [Dehalococcoidia bacterium]|jgi:signal transduction histidine kinase